MTESRRMLVLLGGVTLLGLCLRGYGITSQPLLLDEMAVAFSAVNYVENGQFGPTMWMHPQLRNIVIYLLGEAFGYGPYALRGVSLCAGIASIPLVGLILHRLTGKRGAAVLAAFFLAVEQVHIVFSRQAIQETWTTLFILAGVYLTLGYRDKDRPGQLIAAGVAFGLGMTCKFHTFFPLAVCLLLCLHGAWSRRSLPRGLFVVSALVFIPLALYLLTYLPWFGRGYGLGDWVAMQRTLLASMAGHQGNVMDQTIDRAAWQWFLCPLGYASFVFADGRPYLTVAFTNPVVWLLVIPATGVQLYRCLRRQRDAGVPLLLALFLVSYAPLAINFRPIWLLSSLAVIPFALMILALTLHNLLGSLTWGRWLITAYLLAVTVGTLYLYPLAIGRGMFHPYLAPIAERFRQDLDPASR